MKGKSTRAVALRALSLAKFVKKRSRPDIKKIEIIPSVGTALADGGYGSTPINPLVIALDRNLAQGVTGGTRIGNSITSRGQIVDLHIYRTDDNVVALGRVRVTIVRFSKRNPSTQPTVTAFMNTTMQINWKNGYFLTADDPGYEVSYKVLYDKHFYLGVNRNFEEKTWTANAAQTAYAYKPGFTWHDDIPNFHHRRIKIPPMYQEWQETGTTITDEPGIHGVYMYISKYNDNSVAAFATVRARKWFTDQ